MCLGRRRYPGSRCRLRKREEGEGSSPKTTTSYVLLYTSNRSTKPPLPHTQPPISIEQFLSLTDVSFIQDIFVPPPTLRPSLAPRASLSTTETTSAECFVAMHEHLPQLELYGRVVEDMERWSAHAAEVTLLLNLNFLSGCADCGWRGRCTRRRKRTR